MSLISMLLAEGSSMERKITNWQKPANHSSHVAKLEIGFYSGSGEYSINYKCSCDESFYLGTADPDMIDDNIWKKNATK